MVGMFHYFLLLGIFASVHAQVPRFGRCNQDIPVVQNFDVNRYLGVWYEYQRYFFIPELLLKCSQATYSLNDDGSIKVINAGQNRLTGAPSQVEGVAVARNSSEPAKLEVKFSESAPPGPYWVLDTDYDSYAVVYSCTNIVKRFLPLRAEVTWILTRSREGITDDVRQGIYDMLNRNGIIPRLLGTTDQTGCTI